MLKFNMFKEQGEEKFWEQKKKEREATLRRGHNNRRGLRGSVGKKSNGLKSPKRLTLSTSTTTTTTTQNAENRQSNDPPESSSFGIQLLSEKPTEWGRSFRRDGATKANLSVEEEPDAIEPTSTTYNPKFAVVRERVPAHPFYDRFWNEEKLTDKFAAMTGPGSYEETGGVGRQVLSTRASSATAVFSTADRLKLMNP